MSDMLFSASWYRVADLKPRLRRQAAIHRHVYRGQPWYVIEDRAGEKHYRFTAATYSLIGLFDGSRTIDEIWRRGVETLGDDAPTQDDMIRLLAQLHAAGLLPTDVTPETEDLLRHHRHKTKQSLLGLLAAPFSLRMPLFDPDRLLNGLLPLANFLFSWVGFVIWLAVVGTGFVLAGLHFNELAADISDKVLAPWTLLVIVIAYPFLKLLHELGHGLATKRWGGRVHDVGVMFVVFVPLPYVDASSSSSFASRWQRLSVDAAGILVELFLAALAMILWLQVEPGALRSFFYAVMLIGSVSTLLFNGNPLLRFDGYYILSDYLEIPNLAQRSQKYLGYLFRRYVFGIKGAVSPVSARGEKGWFLLYGIASGVYKVVLAVVISLFVATEYPVVGGILGLYAVVLMMVLPIGKTIQTLVSDPQFKAKRLRVLATLAGIAALTGWFVGVQTFPVFTVVEGVTVTTENRRVRTEADGFLDHYLVAPGQIVKKGDRLMVLTDPTVEAEERALTASLNALKAQYQVVAFTNRVEAGLIREEIKGAEASLADVSKRRSEQVVVAEADGIFSVRTADDQLGRFFKRGAAMGAIIDPGTVVIATAVQQDQVGTVREGVEMVKLFPLERDAVSVPAKIMRFVPGGHNEVPDPALAVSGGGAIPLDPRSTDKPRTLANVFQIDVTPEAGYTSGKIGERFLVRFEHRPETLFVRANRVLRRVFLDRFGI